MRRLDRSHPGCDLQRRACARRPVAAPRRVRGVAALAFVTTLLVTASLVLWVMQASAAGARGALVYLDGDTALYAAESGMELALRELKLGSDLSGDGVVGAVSDDGNDANDPTLASAAFHVNRNVNVLTATASIRGCRRVLEAETQ